MRVALIYPPTCDPTAPYIALPTLAAYLRQNGVTVLQIDANIEAFDHLLRPDFLSDMAKRVMARFRRLLRKSSLDHLDEVLYARLWPVVDDLTGVAEGIEDALAVLRDRTGQRFYDPLQYEVAIQTVSAALRIVSAAYSPLEMDFSAYRTPFGLLNEAQILLDAGPERNPFHAYFEGDLCDDLRANGIDLVGICLAFPGQIQPGYALAYTIGRKLPGVHITVGGPAMTQLLVRLDLQKQATVLGPFHSAVLYEGEHALLDLLRMLDQGQTPQRVIIGKQQTDLTQLPAPDFDGLPLEKYLSPEPVLPYDPTRGCYWAKCAFCHYGLCDHGTAGYRERPVAQAAGHLRELSRRWNCRIFYFSQDAFAPSMARALSQEIRDQGLNLKWASDMRPEPDLTAPCCRDLADGGALSLALGIESACPRILGRIHKGLSLSDIKTALINLADAHIAAEAMCFTDFPTETVAEAAATLTFIENYREKIALFICGRFGLSHGSRVARHPEDYGIDQIWQVAGDELLTGLFYREQKPAKTEAQREAIDRTIDVLSKKWWLHDYPWAGSLSTAHTLLWYARRGHTAFRDLAATPRPAASKKKGAVQPGRFDSRRILAQAAKCEADIWRHLVYELKAVSPELYRKLARHCPVQRPKPDKGRVGRKKG
jgi:hypothetical protein